MRLPNKASLDNRFILITVLIEIGAVFVAIPVLIILFFTPLSGHIANAAEAVSTWAKVTPPARPADRTQYRTVVFTVSTPTTPAVTATPLPALSPPQITIQEGSLGQNGMSEGPEGAADVTEEYHEGELNGVRVGIFIKVRTPPQPTPSLLPSSSIQPIPQIQPQVQSPAQPLPQPQFSEPGYSAYDAPDNNTPTTSPIGDTPLLGLPVQGKIRQGFGCSPFFTGIRGQDCAAPLPWFHDGIDIAAVEGKPVRAMMTGTVIWAGMDGTGPACGEYRGFGKGVILDSGDGWQTLYAHLSQINVQVGDVVTPETIVGAVGKTGCVTGSHLHFGLRHKGDLVNPKEFIRQ